ncbi:hypothetical protein EP331_10990 [bacterium]|nr:MAG: hypothetical protein EP331_10990 [bacterium]
MDTKDKYPPINVLNIFRGFNNPKLKHAITPIRFELANGTVHKVTQIRQTHKERVGQAIHIHFVVQTSEQRYFNIVFDTGELQWRLVQEFDSELLFNY